MDWLTEAKRLPVGGSRKIMHDCTSASGSVSLSIHHEVDCWRAYCFRCHESYWKAKVLPPGERLRLRNEAEAASARLRKNTNPPVGTQRWAEWPEEAQAWLARAGIGERMAQEFGYSYDPSSRRVIVRYGAFWQARAVFPDQPAKYITPAGIKPMPLVLSRLPSDNGVVVLTEDILSAHRLVMNGFSVLPLCGTTLRTSYLALILRKDYKVIVWLDPDPPGQAAAAAVMKRLKAFGIPCANIESEADPKHHSADHMWKLIGGIIWH